MSGVRTARVLREERRAAVSVAFGKTLDATGATNTAIGEMLGVSDDRVRHYRDPNKFDAALSFADFAALPFENKRALAEEIAFPRAMIVELPEVSTMRSGLAQHVVAHRENTELLTVHLEAVADGKVTRAEGLKILAEADEAIRELLTIRALARRAIEEGVVDVEPAREEPSNVTRIRGAK